MFLRWWRKRKRRQEQLRLLADKPPANKKGHPPDWLFKPLENGCTCYMYDLCMPTLNVGRIHVGYCEVCRHYMIYGENLSSSWHYEDQEIWDENKRFLKTFDRCDCPNHWGI